MKNGSDKINIEADFILSSYNFRIIKLRPKSLHIKIIVFRFQVCGPLFMLFRFDDY